MSRVRYDFPPRTLRRAEALGERLRLARLRRRMTLDALAERAMTTRVTLARLERGDLGVSLALLTRVLGVLGLEEDLDRIATDDELGHRLQDIRLTRPRRAGERTQLDG